MSDDWKDQLGKARELNLRAGVIGDLSQAALKIAQLERKLEQAGRELQECRARTESFEEIMGQIKILLEALGHEWWLEAASAYRRLEELL